jgi:gluconate 2-dehydrogenase
VKEVDFLTKPKVLIGVNVPENVEEYIGKHCEYEKFEEHETVTYEKLLGKLHDKEGLMLAVIKVDGNLLDHGPKLKVVSDMTVGYDNFDIEAMKERKIIGTNTPEVLDDTVADLVFGLMLSTARRLSELDKYVKDGDWKIGDNEINFGKDVHHETLGIIGMGRIGETVAKRAKFGFDMDVLYYNRNRKPEAEEKLGVRYAELNTLLQKSDFVLVMVALTEETYHMIGKEEFKMMKKEAILINGSRGATVNEKELIEALLEKEIWGAGLDVFEQEPIDRDNTLLKMSNVVTLPHIGSATWKTRDDMAMLAAENMVKAVCGVNPPNIVAELK